MSNIVDQLDDVLLRRDAAIERRLLAPEGSPDAAAAAAERDRLQAELWALKAHATPEELLAAVLRPGRPEQTPEPEPFVPNEPSKEEK